MSSGLSLDGRPEAVDQPPDDIHAPGHCHRFHGNLWADATDALADERSEAQTTRTVRCPGPRRTRWRRLQPGSGKLGTRPPTRPAAVAVVESTATQRRRATGSPDTLLRAVKPP